MTFKQFKKWCNDRACDGCWGFKEATYCIELIRNMMRIPWWRRNKVWREIETQVLCAIVTPTNRKIQGLYGCKTDDDYSSPSASSKSI